MIDSSKLVMHVSTYNLVLSVLHNLIWNNTPANWQIKNTRIAKSQCFYRIFCGMGECLVYFWFKLGNLYFCFFHFFINRITIIYDFFNHSIWCIRNGHLLIKILRNSSMSTCPCHIWCRHFTDIFTINKFQNIFCFFLICCTNNMKLCTSKTDLIS